MKGIKSTLYDVIFEDDYLFHTLEELFSNFSRKSSSKDQGALNHREIHQYSQIRNKHQDFIDKLQDLIDRFQYSECERSRIAAFFVLEFVVNHYSLEVLDVQKGELFQDKMNSMSSRFQLLAELQNIHCYMAKKNSSDLNLTDDMKSIGGEAVMLHKYHHLLLPKIQQILSHNEMEHCFLNLWLHRETKNIEHGIEEIMYSRKYYLLK
ncbi:hypothetical protein VP01_2031g1 [Puccinia sorghi]|uniref:Uncharacterized protein n=1 Tax=Puccinia sorghi TaxID=27349 RepID=A0A0L6VB66_9BASI|nr:hypothetical protein VP01_2031g1 [Puccinia sorghi]